MEKNVLSKDSEQDDKKNETMNKHIQELKEKLKTACFGRIWIQLFLLKFSDGMSKSLGETCSKSLLMFWFILIDVDALKDKLLLPMKRGI